MKKLTVCLLLVMLASFGCGGGEGAGIVPADNPVIAEDNNNNETTPVPEDNALNGLPDIVDDYDDDVFKYVDQQLYQGEYEFYDILESTCETFLGDDIESKKALVTVNDQELVYESSDGQQVLNVSTEQDIAYAATDLWGYQVDYEGRLCVLALSSAHNQLENNTYDLAVLGCEDENAYGGICFSTYIKKSDNNYASVSIKSLSSQEEPTLTQQLIHIRDAVLDTMN